MAMAASRPSLRSAMASFRTSAGTKSKPMSSPFHLPNAKPTISQRILRSPVELSSCVDSMMPFHTATSSALLASLISVSRTACWLSEGCGDDS